MKRVIALCVCASVVFSAACGRSAPAEVSDVPSSVTQVTEPITAQDFWAANDTYGESAESGGLLVRDESVLFRTADSRRLEPIAIQYAQDTVRGGLSDPDSLQITDCIVSNCADDGDNTYYVVSFSFSYVVATGERIDNADSYSIGVHKADKKAFDASKKIKKVLDKYSVFRRTDQRFESESDTNAPDADSAAAESIAASHLKNADTGKVLSVRKRPDGSDGSLFTWEVRCEGENDYGMRIQDVYTVYLLHEDGKIVEFDPDAP